MASCQVQRGAVESHWGSAIGKVALPNLLSGTMRGLVFFRALICILKRTTLVNQILWN